ncbi:hypothetical protein RclHR1_06680001 [Rhizophagus clarus]|uniref:Uncharacterized protein n=1 Tax=Rhizophagus clarus TaxID=94130 RepID=A0A2Z6S5Y0_9GLOM|nr:hypothetical protein RclHR1_06680001 [Rhizophagus clarus]GES80009.1 hypothetical protein GLOIN_2v1782042 [Rhizophagus clarus]
MSTKSLLDRFLDIVKYSNIYSLPCNGDAHLLATQTRNLITGKDLIKQNVENEVHRLQLYDHYLIIKATDYIWNLHSTSFQKERFENLANNVNIIININQNRNSFINNSDTIDRITRITLPQKTNDDNSIENFFFNGTNFHENGGLGL